MGALLGCKHAMCSNASYSKVSGKHGLYFILDKPNSKGTLNSLGLLFFLIGLHSAWFDHKSIKDGVQCLINAMIAPPQKGNRLASAVISIMPRARITPKYLFLSSCPIFTRWFKQYQQVTPKTTDVQTKNYWCVKRRNCCCIGCAAGYMYVHDLSEESWIWVCSNWMSIARR